MSLQRYLDHIEIRSLNNAPSYVITYDGEIDAAQMEHAYRLLFRRHPVLGTRITFDGSGYLLHMPVRPVLDFAARTGDEDTLLGAIREPWDCRSGVSRLIMVSQGQHGHVAFRVDHAVADAGIKMALLRELLESYAELSHGSEPHVERGDSLPVSPFTLIKERVYGGIGGPPPGPARVPRPTCTLLEKRIQFTPDDSARIVHAARSLHTTVHALICGAILVAHRNQSNYEAPAPMTCWSPVNVRSRATPAVEPTETTNMALIQETEVTVPLCADPVQVGREVKKFIDDDISKGRLPTGEPRRTDTPLDPHLATILISNFGVVLPFAQAQGMTITDFQTLSPPKVGRYPVYGAYTFDGRLNIPIRYPLEKYPAEITQGIIGEIIHHLREVGTHCARGEVADQLA